MGIFRDYIQWIYRRYAKPANKKFMFAAGGSIDLIKYKKLKNNHSLIREVLFLIIIILIPVSIFALYSHLLSLNYSVLLLSIGFLIAIIEFAYFLFSYYIPTKCKNRYLAAGFVGFLIHLSYAFFIFYIVGSGFKFPKWAVSIQNYSLFAPWNYSDILLRKMGCTTWGCTSASMLMGSVIYALIAIGIYFLYSKLKK